MARNKGIFGLLYNFIFFWTKASSKYHDLKDNEEKRPVTTKMGIKSIVLSIVGAAFVILCVFGAVVCFKNVGSSLFIFIIAGLAVCIAGAIVAFVQGLMGALMHWIYQLKLNKKPVGYAAMAIWIVCLIAAIVASLLILLSV